MSTTSAASVASIGAQVRQRRRSLGLTQDDVADLAGASPRFIGALEAGKTTFRVDKLAAVLEALGLELSVSVRRSE